MSGAELEERLRKKSVTISNETATAVDLACRVMILVSG